MSEEITPASPQPAEGGQTPQTNLTSPTTSEVKKYAQSRFATAIPADQEPISLKSFRAKISTESVNFDKQRRELREQIKELRFEGFKKGLENFDKIASKFLMKRELPNRPKEQATLYEQTALTGESLPLPLINPPRQTEDAEAAERSKGAVSVHSICGITAQTFIGSTITDLQKAPAIKNQRASLKGTPLSKPRVTDTTSLSNELAKNTQYAMELTRHIINLHELMSTPPRRGHYSDTSRAIIAKLEQAFQSPGYQMLKEQESNLTIAFLHSLVKAMYEETKGETLYQKSAQELLSQTSAIQELPSPKNPDLNAWKAIGNNLSTCLEELKKVSPTKNSKVEKVSYMIGHPFRAFHSVQSETSILGEFRPLNSNHILSRGIFKMGDSSILHVYTPTPTIGNTASPLIKAYLQHLENLQFTDPDDHGNHERKDPLPNDQPTFLHIYTLQKMTHGEEARRTQAIMGLAEEFPISCKVDGWDFDGALCKAQGPFESYQDAPTYTAQISKELFSKSPSLPKYQYLSSGLGAYFPSLTEDDMRTVLALNQNLFSQFSDDKHWLLFSPKEKAQIHNMVLMSMAGFLIQIKDSKEHKNMVVHEMCKQNVDRGAVANALRTVFFYSLMDLSGDEINWEQAQLDIVDGILGRSSTVDDRLIMDARVQPLIKFLQVVDRDSLQLAMGSLFQTAHPERDALTQLKEYSYAPFVGTDLPPSSAAAQ